MATQKNSSIDSTSFSNILTIRVEMNDLMKNFRFPPNSFDEEFVRLKNDLDQWYLKLTERVENEFSRSLIDLETSFERFGTFVETLEIFLDEEKFFDRNVLTNSAEFLNISSRLSWIENEINLLKNVSFKVKFDEIEQITRPNLVNEKPPVESETSSTPCRVLLKREQIEQLDETINKSDYSLTTHSSSPEAILTTTNLQKLSVLIEQILSSNNEIRVLIPEFYASLIIGQLGARAKMLKEKFALTNIKIFPICAPLSTERILLLSASENEQIFRCLTEIFLNLFENSSIDVNHQAIFLYSPEFYDVSIVDDYGGFFDRKTKTPALRPISNETTINDDDDLTEYEDEDVEDFDHENNFSTEIVEPLRERHWTLSDAQAGALFGPNCSRLHQIRSESNAWIVIYEAEGKNSRRPMSIRGTKAEIEHATRLILDTIKRHDRKLPLKHNQKRGR